MRKNNILSGLALIAVAVLIVANGMGVLPDIPWFQAIVSIGFVAFSIGQILRRHFFWSMISLGCVAWIWDEYLGIEQITPFPLLLAAGLLGIGLGMMFGKKHRIVSITKDGKTMSWEEAKTENWEDGRHVTLENICNSTNKYVNSEAFSTADFSNVFGSANVYFNNAIIAGNEADISVQNVFGQLNLYFPSTWRLQVEKEAIFGGVEVHGRPCTDPDAPIVRMDVDSVFGGVNIYFE